MLYDLTVSNAVVSNSALDGDASEMEEGKNINKTVISKTQTPVE